VIINIRGTSGSGKTHLVRELMKSYQTKTVYRREGRKQPIGYLFHHPEGRKLAVIGHYETACGGCDTISKMEEIFDLVRTSASAGYDVVFEGLLISADVNRTVELNEWAEQKDIPMEVIALTTPIEECLDSVNARRRARNPDLPPVKEKNTISKFNGVKKSLERLRQAGVTAHELSRSGALAHLQGSLGLQP
jgi:thymidylate kinase